jgi:hypothetical protein
MKNPQCGNCTGDLTEKNLRHGFITPKDGAVAGEDGRLQEDIGSAIYQTRNHNWYESDALNSGKNKYEKRNH